MPIMMCVGVMDLVLEGGQKLSGTLHIVSELQFLQFNSSQSLQPLFLHQPNESNLKKDTILLQLIDLTTQAIPTGNTD